MFVFPELLFYQQQMIMSKVGFDFGCVENSKTFLQRESNFCDFQFETFIKHLMISVENGLIFLWAVAVESNFEWQWEVNNN